MHIFALVVGLILILMVLLDAFETIVLPRTVRRAIRVTSIYTWAVSRAYTSLGKMRRCSRRQTLLNGFAPMMLLGLIVMWTVAIVFGFALVYWGARNSLNTNHDIAGLAKTLYFSGGTFFTLGFGEVVPSDGIGRFFAVCEAGLGLAFLALIIAYIPVIYAAFSRREVQMLLLDSKAGSEPTAAELLRRHASGKAMPALIDLLKDWERFSAELLESYLSYPVLAYYRSQHDNQNWLHSLCAIMDACALVGVGFEGNPPWAAELQFQAQATFAMARHVVVDLAYILDVEPQEPLQERLSSRDSATIRALLGKNGLNLSQSESAEARLKEIRILYEPFLCGLSRELVMDLPTWISEEHIKDNWETTAWDGAKHF